jgi:hypothetical protein
MEAYQLPYHDIMSMPYSIREALIKEKERIDEDREKDQEKKIQQMKSKRR